MTKKERVLAVMKKEQVDMIPAGFWFHYKSDYTVQQMISYLLICLVTLVN